MIATQICVSFHIRRSLFVCIHLFSHTQCPLVPVIVRDTHMCVLSHRRPLFICIHRFSHTQCPLVPETVRDTHVIVRDTHVSLRPHMWVSFHIYVPHFTYTVSSSACERSQHTYMSPFTYVGFFSYAHVSFRIHRVL